MDIANAGMGKLKGILKKVAIVEMVVWVVLFCVGIILLSTLGKESHGIWIVGGIVILLGLISGITLFYAVQKNETLLYKIWFGETLLLILGCVVGVVLAGLLLGQTSSSAEGWIALICFIVLIPIKIYFFLTVWKFYKWNNRAGVVNAVASAFS